jgi:hypothetical protein
MFMHNAIVVASTRVRDLDKKEEAAFNKILFSSICDLG